MAFKGLIEGTLGYERKKEFLGGNSLYFRDVEIFNYEIYAADFQTFNPDEIQNLILSEFSEKYAGDISVKIFQTNNTLQYPSDSIRASKFTVNVEIFKNLDPEGEGITKIVLQRGKKLLNFREEIAISKNENGNRDFTHSFSFGVRDDEGENVDYLNNYIDKQTSNKNTAKEIASQIFEEYEYDQYTSILPELINISNFKTYYTETYDLIKNSYSFSRKREISPFKLNSNTDSSNYNLNHSITMAENGVVEVNEKATMLSFNDFDLSKSELDSLYTDSFTRCQNIFNSIGPEPNSAILILKDTPIKLIKNYNKQSLSLGYDVTYSNSPEVNEDGLIISQIIDFNINEYNKVEATHTYDYTLNKFLHDYDYFLSNHMDKESESFNTMSDYYFDLYPNIESIFPKFSLIKTSVDLPNIKTKASLKYSYSNDPTYFVTIDGIEFKIFNVSVNKKLPTDIINEYKIINRSTRKNRAVLSYSYQNVKGELEIKITANVGKNSDQFYLGGDFLNIGENKNKTITQIMDKIYQYAGILFLNNFPESVNVFNWFISDSSFSFDSEGIINATINYNYSLKLHNS